MAIYGVQREATRFRRAASPLAGAIVVAVTLFSGDIGCGSRSAPGSAPTCNGQPATFPLDDLKTGQEDALLTEVAQAVAQSLSPGELAYLSQIPASAINSKNVFTDPVVRKAMAAALPMVCSYCTTLTQRSSRLTLGVAYAFTQQQQLYFAVAGQIIAEYFDVIATGALAGLAIACGTTPCVLAAFIGSFAILIAEAKAGDLPPIGDPIFPSLYTSLVDDSGGGGGGGASGGSGVFVGSAASGGNDGSGASVGSAASGGNNGSGGSGASVGNAAFGGGAASGSCPTGFVGCNGECASTTCPDGFHFDVSTCVCQ
jgi:hypothetical protein